MSAQRTSRGGKMDDRADYLEAILELPSRALIGDGACQNVIEQIRTIRGIYDEEDQIDLARYALRAVAAIMPPGQDDAYTIAQIAGFDGCNANDFFSALAGTGPWSGEIGFETMRRWLAQIVYHGKHPNEASKQIRMTETEYVTINLLLGIEKHWKDTIPDRVFLAVHSGEDDDRIREIARCGRMAAKRWRKWAHQALKEMQT